MASTGAVDEYREVSVQEASETLQAGSGTYVDVRHASVLHAAAGKLVRPDPLAVRRTTAEFNAGRPRGAVHVPIYEQGPGGVHAAPDVPLSSVPGMLLAKRAWCAAGMVPNRDFASQIQQALPDKDATILLVRLLCRGRGTLWMQTSS